MIKDLEHLTLREQRLREFERALAAEYDAEEDFYSEIMSEWDRENQTRDYYAGQLSPSDYR